ncbi:SH3 domain-containing protein 2-like isoform X2 [Salvia splendens]|nr:SH3 domain-containing protein 2-like isoform X2 [Salvia splendens]XP_042006631.1 SH3 domain-containing protein 2-like isoform X2 [Salvia splendens]
MKLNELKSNMVTLGKEATSAMAAVEHQQQRLTLQRLIAMMLSARQQTEVFPNPARDTRRNPASAYNEGENLSASKPYDGSFDGTDYFLGEVIQPYQAESDVELTLALGDYVVVRKVTNNGWAEGECKCDAGWFPFEFVERWDRVLASKVAEVF